ncbi:MAG TPA: hypothetical protein EYP90_05420, partial [Chromatiaceae bacterium]|nr:hypothetical protein [Chromatiaceae bacterium]
MAWAPSATTSTTSSTGRSMVTEPKRLLLLPVAALMLLFSLPVTGEESELLDRIVAVVNDDVVLKSELDQELAAIQEKLSQAGAAGIPEREIRKQALERVILRKLQLQEAEKLGIEVDELMLQQAIQTIAERNGLTLPEMEKA